MTRAGALVAALLLAQVTHAAEDPDCTDPPHEPKKYDWVLLKPSQKANDQEERAHEISRSVRCVSTSVGALVTDIHEQATADKERDGKLASQSGRIEATLASTSTLVAETRNIVARLADERRKADPAPPCPGCRENDAAPASNIEITVNRAAELAEKKADADAAADKNTRRQLDPTTPVRRYFPEQTRAEFAILLVPDPRIPRHRRAYDNTIVSVTQGMLRNKFVLDGYEFPWQGQLSGAPQPDERPQKVFEDADYGVMVFRKDGWRARDDGPHRDVRVLYVVPEAVTYGVQTPALLASVAKIREQCPGEKPESAIPCVTGSRIKVFGPFFSGSLDSLLRTGLDLELQASGATSQTNGVIEIASGGRITYRTGAVDDVSKLDELRKLADELDVAWEHVAVLGEASVFGRYACPDDRDTVGVEVAAFCRRAKWLYFPVNIADVRFGVRQKLKEKHAQVREQAQVAIPVMEQRLSLQDGAENGSELPESQQSPLTAVSTQLDLEVALRRLRDVKARVVAVIATDVRDRLFLFEEIRKQAPNALLVDFETDRLIAHPDFIHASRGALMISSSTLLNKGDPWTAVYAAPTDIHMILLRTIQRWSDCAEPKVHLHTVTRTGLIEADAQPDTRGFLSVDTLPFITMVLSLCVVWAFASWRLESSPWFALGGCLHVAAPILIVVGLCLSSGRLPPAVFYLFAMLWVGLVIWFARKTPAGAAPPPISAVQETIRWVPRLLLALILLILLIGEAVRLKYSPEPLAHFVGELNGSWSRGLGYSEAVKVGVVGLLLAFCYAHAYSQVTIAHQACVNELLTKPSAQALVARSYRQETCFWTVPGALLCLFIAWAGWRIAVGDVRLTIWGATAGKVAFATLVAMTFVTFALFCGALRVVRRIHAWTYAADEVFVSVDSKWLEERLWGLPRLAPTPIAAMAFSCSCDSAVAEKADSKAGAQLRLSNVLGAEMTLYRWASIGVGISSIVAAWMVYLFPITHADELLLANLCLLIPTGFMFAYNTVRFERNAVLSRLLCDRDQRTEFSMPLFGYVALPFVILAIVIGITQVPGVLDWGAGIISLLTNTIKLGG